MHDAVGTLPNWLIVGLVLGTAFAGVIAVLFVAGSRAFPSPESAARPGGGRRTGEIRSYLAEIGERFVEGQTVAGYPVAFYLPDRDVAVTFDANAFFAIEETDTYAVLVEQELPGWQIGRRLPFETPAASTARPTDECPSPSSLAEARETLGVSPSADTEEIRAAYRSRVKEVHPDHGGDRDAFERVQSAYATVRDRGGTDG